MSDLQTGLENRANRELSPEFRERIFKPGQSGNPNGRPKRTLTERLTRQLLRDKALKRNEIVDALIARAIDTSEKTATASVRAIEQIFDRVEGKVPAALSLTGADGGPLQIEIVCVGAVVAAENVIDVKPDKQ